MTSRRLRQAVFDFGLGTRSPELNLRSCFGLCAPTWPSLPPPSSSKAPHSRRDCALYGLLYSSLCRMSPQATDRAWLRLSKRNSRTNVPRSGAGRLECHQSCRAFSLGPTSCLCKTLSSSKKLKSHVGSHLQGSMTG